MILKEENRRSLFRERAASVSLFDSRYIPHMERRGIEFVLLAIEKCLFIVTEVA